MLILFQDHVGLRGIFLVTCNVLTLLAFGLLAFTYVPPLVCTVIIGVAYSCASVILTHWSFPMLDRSY